MLRAKGPDEIYGDLFQAVQGGHVFPDSKTFVDCTPKYEVPAILQAFAELPDNDTGTLQRFVHKFFSLPVERDVAVKPSDIPPVRDRIEELWGILSRAADRADPDSSLIALPRPYIVPGGRFREIYYWDTYFTMLGLADAGRCTQIEDMVENFAYLIDEIGFIPNGNRTYFCTRSQPPFFVLMVELLAQVRNDDSIMARFLPQLRREYDFWMRGADTLTDEASASRRVVRAGAGYLNRYWDDADKPRQESYAEDIDHASGSGRKSSEYFRDIRAACESGWDFSARWLDDSERLESICTTSILPVDLNALMCRLEKRLAEGYAASDSTLAEELAARASYRAETLRTDFFDPASGFFVDLQLPSLASTGVPSLAAAFPLFLGIATPEQARQVAAKIRSDFLAPGGWVTTLRCSGQQWDRPNGWAPLQWIVFQGLSNYGFVRDAELGAYRWASDNIEIYKRTGRLFEKYDVEHVDTLATGGEYDVQDGFGWTNGVLLRLMNRLNLP